MNGNYLREIYYIAIQSKSNIKKVKHYKYERTLYKSKYIKQSNATT